MTVQITVPSDPIVRALDRAGVAHLVHVRGGDGSLLAALLARFPQATGVLFDRPASLADAGAVLAAAGVADRVDVAAEEPGGAVPPGGDVYLVTLGSADVTEIRAMLRRCRAAMTPTARLVLCAPSADWRAIDGVVEGEFTVVAADGNDPAWRVVVAQSCRT